MKCVYGPVPSRRLGMSLGVDLVPKKICTYDCVYCQIGRTTRKTLERKEYVPLSTVVRDVGEALKDWERDIDYVTISGSGEPTLNSAIGDIIAEIRRLTIAPVAVITNSSLLYLKEVRTSLLQSDVIMPSLDAVTPSVFETINRPHSTLAVAEIIHGLELFRSEYKGQIWLEILLCRGINDGPKDIEELRKAILTIRPDKVHLNTVVRPAVEDYASALTLERMEKIRESLGRDVEIIADFGEHRRPTTREDVEGKVMRTLQRRPMTSEDLSNILGLHDLEIQKILYKLTREGKIRYRVFNQKIFYEIDKREIDKRV